MNRHTPCVYQPPPPAEWRYADSFALLEEIKRAGEVTICRDEFIRIFGCIRGLDSYKYATGWMMYYGLEGIPDQWRYTVTFRKKHESADDQESMGNLDGPVA